MSTLDNYRGKPCVICLKPSDPCHIKSRGAGGKDTDKNLISMCRKHHTMQHQIGWSKMIKKYPILSFSLQLKGWTLVSNGNVTKLMRV